MADEYDDQENDLVPRSQIRALEEKAKKAAELEARLAEMERRSVFSDALGDAAKDPKMKYFIDGYKGELTPEAIKAEATEVGFLTAPRQSDDQFPTGPTSAEMAAHARMAASAEGVGGDNRISWQEAMAAADRIPNEAEREAAILSVVERYGGVTSRTAQ